MPEHHITTLTHTKPKKVLTGYTHLQWKTLSDADQTISVSSSQIGWLGGVCYSLCYRK